MTGAVKLSRDNNQMEKGVRNKGNDEAIRAPPVSIAVWRSSNSDEIEVRLVGVRVVCRSTVKPTRPHLGIKATAIDPGSKQQQRPNKPGKGH